ncbi:MAG: metal-sensing transcriptional repressor [Bilifractor sp.]
MNQGTAVCGCADGKSTADTGESLQEAVQEGEEKTCACASGRHKQRTPEEQKALLTRLKRVEGQIRGIEKMVENNAYCPDILVQVSAATSALNSFNKVLLGCHIRGCVVDDIRKGNDETIDELCKVLQKLMK